jgi:hypothetical protein
MTAEQQLIFDWIGTVPVLVPNWEKRLPQMYNELNAKWFDKSLPPISDNFVCEFCDMPRDTAGIYIDEKDAAAQSTAAVKIRPGIRINSGLKILRDHVAIALLHEMVHVSGIRGHREPFKAGIARLMLAGAYNDLL